MPSIGSRGDKLDLNVRQGATFGPIHVRMAAPSGVPVDLTGCVVRAAIRKSYTSTPPYEVACQLVAPLEGRFEFLLPATLTETMPCGSTPTDSASSYVWDLEVEFANGTVMPVFYGVVRVAPEAAR